MSHFSPLTMALVFGRNVRNKFSVFVTVIFAFMMQPPSYKIQPKILQIFKTQAHVLEKFADMIFLQHDVEMSEFKKQIEELLRAIDEEKSTAAEKLKSLNKEHSEELKNLHSQHHRQVCGLYLQKRDSQCRINEGGSVGTCPGPHFKRASHKK